MPTTTTSPPPQRAPVPLGAPAPVAAAASRPAGVALALAGATSTQVGAAVGARAFDALGTVGVVAVRQVVAAALLLPVARPAPHRFSWAQWWPVLLLAGSFAGMNPALYAAIDRIGLALAVTLEFLGPLAVALAASRGRRDLLIAGVAGAGVYLLVMPGPSSDALGVGLGLAAAACWAAYVLLNRVVGQRLPGLQGTAAASAVTALASLPVLALLADGGRLVGWPLLAAAVAGLLSSAVPYAVDLLALRRLPPRTFGVLMSAHPVLAAVAGMLLLGELLLVREWAGMLVVVAANVAAVTTGPGGAR